MPFARREVLTAVAAALPGLAMHCGPASAAIKPPVRRQNPWQLLFNGVDLDGWSFYQDGVGDTDRFNAVAIEDGVLRLLGPGYGAPDGAGFGRLTTTRRFADYHLRLDYRFGDRRFAPRSLAKRNSGILYHMAPTEGVLYPDCIEFQMEETDVGDAILVNVQGIQGPDLGGTPVWPTLPPFLPRTYAEPLVFGGLARQWYRKNGNFERLGEWNTLDIIAFGDTAAHIVNGRVVTTLFGLIEKPAPGKQPVPLTGGRIALEMEGAEVLYRNVMIRQLDAADIAQILKG